MRVPVLDEREHRRKLDTLGAISPELVLVTPELREAALASLPDLDAA